MLRRVVVAAVLVLLPLLPLPAAHAATSSADSVSARRRLNQALEYCRQISSDTIEILAARMPIFNPPAPDLALRMAAAATRLSNWLELIELQSAWGDSLVARRNARHFLKWRVGQLRAINSSMSDDDAIRWLCATNERFQAVVRRASLGRHIPGCEPPVHSVGLLEALTDSLGPDRTLTYLKSNLPEFYKASAFELALGSAGLLSLPTVRQVVADLSEDDRTGVLNNFCLDHCRKHDWRSARAVVDIIPDRWRYKPWILGLIAEEALRSRARVDAMNLVTQALKLCRSFVPQEVVGGYAQIGTVYVKLGRLDLAAELLREAPDPAQRKILLELATRTAEAGPPDSVLAIFRRAQKLPPEFPITRNPDQGLEQWIEAMADSGHDMIALQAADGLLFGPDRGWARSLVALSQIRRGLLAEAERTVNLIEQNPFRLADALVELAIAQAAAGDVVAALRMVDRIAPDATAMCEYPIEQVPVVCPDPISCPPVGHIFRSRMKALREIGATAAGRVAVDSLVAERSAAESAALLIGAVSGLSRH